MQQQTYQFFFTGIGFSSCEIRVVFMLIICQSFELPDSNIESAELQPYRFCVQPCIPCGAVSLLLPASLETTPAAARSWRVLQPYQAVLSPIIKNPAIRASRHEACWGLVQALCKMSYWMSTALGFAALVLIWLFYPSTYNFGQALGDSHYFLKTQRVGRLPDKSVSWRGDSLLQEYAINFNTKTYDFGGGWMTVRSPFLALAPIRLQHLQLFRSTVVHGKQCSQVFLSNWRHHRCCKAALSLLLLRPSSQSCRVGSGTQLCIDSIMEAAS